MPIVECGAINLNLPPPLTAQAALEMMGPSILVDIGFDPAVLTQISTGGLVHPPVAGISPNVQQVLALIDTGARESCIDDALAQQLQLPLVNQQQAAGVGGLHILNVYLAFIAIPLLATVQAGIFIGAQLAAGGQP